MPKKKQRQPRRAKGVSVASSAGAFNALKSAGIDSGGFIGFGAFAADTGSNDDLTSADNLSLSSSVGMGGHGRQAASTISPFYQGNNTKLKVVFKGISKKDATTKLKSVQELQRILPDCDRPDLARALPHFAYIYIKDIRSNDRRLRYHLNHILKLFAAQEFTKLFKRLLSDLIFPWYKACFDVYDAAAKEAKIAFHMATRSIVSSNKKLGENQVVNKKFRDEDTQLTKSESFGLEFFLSSVGHNFDKVILQMFEELYKTLFLAPKHFAEVGDDDSAIETRYQRNITAVLRGFKYGLNSDKLIFCDELKEDRPKKFQMIRLYDQKKFWKFSNLLKYSRIHLSFYHLNLKIMEKFGKQLEPYQHQMGITFLGKGLKIEGTSKSEKNGIFTIERNNLLAIWDAVLLYLQIFQATYSNVMNLRKTFYPALQWLIKNQFYGFTDLCCSNMVLVCSLLPTQKLLDENVGDAHIEDLDMRLGLLMHLVALMKDVNNQNRLRNCKASSNDDLSHTKAVLECILYLFRWYDSKKSEVRSSDAFAVLVEKGLLPTVDIIFQTKASHSADVELELFNLLARIFMVLNAAGLVSNINLITKRIMSGCKSDARLELFLTCMSHSNVLRALSSVQSFANEIFSTIFKCSRQNIFTSYEDAFGKAAIVAYKQYGIATTSEALKDFEMKINDIIHNIVELSVLSETVDAEAYAKFSSIFVLYKTVVEDCVGLSGSTEYNEHFVILMNRIFEVSRMNIRNSIFIINVAIKAFGVYPSNTILSEFVDYLLGHAFWQKGSHSAGFKDEKVTFLSNLVFFLAVGANDALYEKIFHTFTVYAENLRNFWYDLIYYPMKVASKMGVERNAMASLEFIDSVCTVIKDGKIVDVSTRQNKNGQTPKIFAGDFLSNIIQIFPHVYSTQVIGGFPDDKIDMSLVSNYAEYLCQKFYKDTISRLWQNRMLSNSKGSELLPLFCAPKYIESLLSVWELRDMVRDVDWNTKKNIMDNFCDQFVDICLASTDLMDSPQSAVHGVVLLLSRLGVFKSNFWKAKQNWFWSSKSEFSVIKFRTFTECLARIVCRVGIAPILEGIYDSNSEIWNPMGEKVLINIDNSTVHLISHLLYAVELMFSNNYLENSTQQNRDQFYSLEEWYDAVLIPFISNGVSNNSIYTMPKLFKKHFKLIVADIVCDLLCCALSRACSRRDAHAYLKASRRLVLYLFGNNLSTGNIGGEIHSGESTTMPLTEDTISSKADEVEIAPERSELDATQTEQEVVVYKRGDAVRYVHKNGKFEAAVILQVHADEDEGRPYFSIRLSSGQEKQTENERLQPLASYVKKTLKGGKHGSPNAPNENAFKKSHREKGSVSRHRRQTSKRNKILEMNKRRSQHAKISWNGNEVAQFMSKIVDNVANHGKNDVVEAHLDYERSLLVASFLSFLAKVTTPLLPKFENIEYEIGFLDALESIIQELANSTESCNITSNFISTLYILTLLVNKCVDEKRLSSMQDNILSSVEKMFQYQGDTVNDIFSWKLLMKLNLDLLVEFKVIKRENENINALKKSLIPFESFFDANVSAFSNSHLHIICHHANHICNVLAGFKDKENLIQNDKRGEYFFGLYLQLLKYLSTSMGIEVTSSSKFTYTQILVIRSLNNFVDFYVDNFVKYSEKTDNAYAAYKMVRHKRFSGDETYLLTLLDIVATKSSPKIQLIAFHILSNEYKDTIGVDVCMIILRKMEAIFGLSPLTSDKHLGLNLLWHLLLRLPTTLHCMCEMESSENSSIFSVEKALEKMLALSCRNLNVLGVTNVDIESDLSCSVYFDQRYLWQVVEGRQKHDVGALDIDSNDEEATENDNVISILDFRVMMKYFSEYYGSFSHTTVHSQRVMSLYSLMETVSILPNMVRKWAEGLNRSDSSRLSTFISSRVSPAIVSREIAYCTNTSALSDTIIDEDDSLIITGSLVSRDIVAEYVKKDCTLEICISLPNTYPLRAVDISCRKRTGVKPEIWRRWALQIRALLSLRNSSISGGILKFCENVDKEFSGVEPCPICYSVIHIVDRSLPKVSCKVCKNKFHSACIYKWFNNSQKSTCPLCRSVF